ncbi:MAG: tRNA (adenosine(37)-N6)-threonylcarbamoyltransferase complex dimerization subunit type 1 TsaB [Desulfuromonadaceae bacterium]|nr:tRNA (adenosine(37)-N6)-threonylcarbamoyltransferase complex dimerization subunit type 1 TsaB [Desulfuromonadaceae bacterium]
MQQLLLSFDTSTPRGSVALVLDTVILAEYRLDVKHRPHSDYILRYARTLLHECGYVLRDVTGLCVVHGPGSFTGLRVGLATVQGLALGLRVPVYQVSSLLVMGFMYGPSPCSQYCLLDARKHELYGARLEWDSSGPKVAQMFVLPPAQVCDLINSHKVASGENESAVLIGEGGALYRELFTRKCHAQLYFSGPAAQYPSAAGAALLRIHWPESSPVVLVSNVQAVYVRPSDAELHSGQTAARQ